MRYDKRYTRVLKIITAPEIPRFKGGVRLCHFCQRRAMFAGSFLDLLADETTNEAKGWTKMTWRR